MKLSVKLHEVDRTAHAVPKFIRDFLITAPSIEQCRKMVMEKIRSEGYELRAISFSPVPPPDGSIIVYVWTKQATEPATRRR